MQQPQAMLHFLRPQYLRRPQQLRRVQPELRVLPTALRPLPRSLADQSHPDADQRLHAHLPRHGDDLLQLLYLLHHQDHLLAQLDPHQRHADEKCVLVAVANDQAARLVLQRQSGEQLRLAPHFQPKLVRLARVQDFLHHFPQLVDLDWKNSPVFVLIIEFGNRRRERLVERLHPVPQYILEPDQHRKLHPPPLGLFDHVRHIHHRSVLPQRHGHDVPRLIDVKVPRPPAIDVVEGACGLDVPGGCRRGNLAHFGFTLFAHYKKTAEEFNTPLQKIFPR